MTQVRNHWEKLAPVGNRVGRARHHTKTQSWTKYCTPFVPVLRRQRQVDLCKFEANPVYRASSRTARATKRNPVSWGKETKAVRLLSQEDGTTGAG
jgi:hypothetical protein